jgi:hypothetical protein
VDRTRWQSCISALDMPLKYVCSCAREQTHHAIKGLGRDGERYPAHGGEYVEMVLCVPDRDANVIHAGQVDRRLAGS